MENEKETTSTYMSSVLVSTLVVLAILGLYIFTTVQLETSIKKIDSISKTAPLNEDEVFIPDLYKNGEVVSPTQSKRSISSKKVKKTISVNIDHHTREVTEEYLTQIQLDMMDIVDAFILADLTEYFAPDANGNYTGSLNITKNCIDSATVNKENCLNTLSSTVYNKDCLKSSIKWNFPEKYNLPIAFNDSYFQTVKDCQGVECPCQNCMAFLQYMIVGVKEMNIVEDKLNATTYKYLSGTLDYFMEHLVNKSAKTNICNPAYNWEQINISNDFRIAELQLCKGMPEELMCICIANRLIKRRGDLLYSFGTGPQNYTDQTIIEGLYNERLCWYAKTVGSDLLRGIFCPSTV